jgi:hypothetical protein
MERLMEIEVNNLLINRGVGDLKLLKNKNSGKIRLLMRADKTHKIVANHLLQRKCTDAKII